MKKEKGQVFLCFASTWTGIAESLPNLEGLQQAKQAAAAADLSYLLQFETELLTHTFSPAHQIRYSCLELRNGSNYLGNPPSTPIEEKASQRL